MALSLAKRLVRSLAVFIVVTFATFSLMYSNGTGIAHAVLGLNATPEGVQAEVVKLGLDQPLLVQYWHWLSGVAHGDFGNSFYTSESVASALSNRVPVTLALVFLTLLLAAVISVISATSRLRSVLSRKRLNRDPSHGSDSRRLAP